MQTPACMPLYIPKCMPFIVYIHTCIYLDTYMDAYIHIIYAHACLYVYTNAYIQTCVYAGEV